MAWLFARKSCFGIENVTGESKGSLVFLRGKLLQCRNKKVFYQKRHSVLADIYNDFAKVAEKGLGSVITAAMNQSFFTLSLGIAAMEIFGSYMSKENTLTGEAVWTARTLL